ncbi:hypothetical protein SprV_0200539600 [Sparganum proliferum]
MFSKCYTDSLTLVFDKNIKEIKLEDSISKYPKNTDADGAELFVPYEQVNGQDYQLVQITGKIGESSL